MPSSEDRSERIFEGLVTSQKGVRILPSFAVIFYGVLCSDSWASVRDSSDSAVIMTADTAAVQPLAYISSH